jgi:hypothetical protein
MLGDPAFDAFRVGDDQPRPDLRIQRVELAQDARQHEFGNGRAGTNQQRPTHFAGHFAEPGFHLVGQGEDFLGVRQHQLAGRRQRNTAVTAFEQPRAVLLLQLLDLEGHGWLRHEQGVGGARETQMFGYGMKNLQTPVSHDDSPDWCAADIQSHSTALPSILVKICCSP